MLACASAVPFVFPERYLITQMTVFFIWATVVTQWNLVLGVGGIFSLAQMALFACGSYGTAMLGYYLHWPLWLAMVPVVMLVPTATFVMSKFWAFRIPEAEPAA